MKQLLFLLVLFPLLLTAQNTINSTSFAETITAKELQENLYVYASDYFQGRETGTIGQKRAIDFLQNFYETHQISPAKGSDHYRQIMNLEIKGEKVATENIVAFLEGSEFPNEYLVISSHLDHIGVKEGEINNGADDDGSGTVALLEIAEAFKAASEAGYSQKIPYFSSCNR